MMIHPQFDPVALSLGPVQVHWYGFMYLLAFVAAYGLAWYRSSKREGWTQDMVSDLVFFGALGVILGAALATSYCINLINCSPTPCIYLEYGKAVCPSMVASSAWP